MTCCCDTISNAGENCNTTTVRTVEREQAITQARTQRLQKRRDALSKRIEDSRWPVNVTIHEMFHVDDQDHALIGARAILVATEQGRFNFSGKVKP
jgi:hypothetical protein